MKKRAFIALLIIACCFLPAISFTQMISFYKDYFMSIPSVRELSSGGYIMCGGGGFPSAMVITKTNNQGIPLWQKKYGDSLKMGVCIQECTDAGYIVVGNNFTVGYVQKGIYLLKTDKDGIVQWAKCFGTFGRGTWVEQTKDGGFIITGQAEAGKGICLVKTDGGGILQWHKTFLYGNGCIGTNVKQTSDGGYVITGSVRALGSNFEKTFLIKTAPSGNVTWDKVYGIASSNCGNISVGNEVWEIQNSNYIIGGYYADLGCSNGYLLKTHSDGTVQKIKGYQAFGDIGLTSIHPTTDGGFVGTGIGYYEVGMDRFFFIKTFSNLDLEWSRGYLGNLGTTIRQTKDFGFIVSDGYLGLRKVDNKGLFIDNCEQPTALVEDNPSAVIVPYILTPDSINNSTNVIPLEAIVIPSVYIRCPVATKIGAISTNPSCNSQCNGSAAVVAGNTGPVTYLWSNSQTTQTITGLCAGIYSVIVTDSTNATFTFTVTITEPPALTAGISNVVHVLCNGQCNGSATVSAGGGTPGYSYSWNTGPVQTITNITGLCPGSYSCIITDANGCTNTQTVSITEPPALTASLAQMNVLCNGQCTASAVVNPLGGTLSYTYLWSTVPVQTNANAAGLCATSYSCTITDANGCTTTQTVTITGPVALLADTSSIADSCGKNNGSASVIASGGTPIAIGAGYSYNWSPGGQTTNTATGLSAGSYTVFINDDNGCTYNANVTVSEIPCPCPANLILTVPNAFSPNNDGENDELCLQGEDIERCVKELTITVYDRWGEAVYSSADSKSCWDGKYQEKMMNTAVFAYYLEATLVSGNKITKKGNVSLLR